MANQKMVQKKVKPNRLFLVLIAATFGLLACACGVPTPGPTTTTTTTTTTTIPYAPPPSPTIQNFSATSNNLPSTGGNVSFSASLTHANTCSLNSTPTISSLPTSIPCSNTFNATIAIPGNSGTQTKGYAFTLKVTGASTQTSNSIGISVGQPQAVDFVSGSLTSDTTWGPTSANVYEVSCDVVVPSGITLTILSGTIIKMCVGGPSYIGIESQSHIKVGGTLNVSGATFTSMNDNSVGGATGTGTPAASDWGGIQVVDGGQANITGSTIAYATTALDAGAKVSVSSTSFNNDGTGVLIEPTDNPVSVTNDAFVNGQYGVSAGSRCDNFFAGPCYGYSGTLTISGNTFSGGSGAVWLALGTSDQQPVTISGNSSSEGGLVFYLISNNLNMSLLGGNTSSGPGGRFFVQGTVSISSAMDSSIPWETANNFCAYQSACSLIIPAGVTLRVDPGAVLKSDFGTAGGYCGICNQVRLQVGGTLNASGATFTSMNDNSVGGATGTGTPAAGDWGGIEEFDSGQANITGSTIAYATVALDAGAKVSVSSTSFNNDGTGVLIEPTDNPVSVTNDAFVNGHQGVLAGWGCGGPCYGYSGTLTISGNTFSGGSGAVWLNMGTFGHSVQQPVTISGNSSSEGGQVFYLVSNNLNMSLLGGNTSSGPGGRFFVAGTVSISSAMDSSIPWETANRVCAYGSGCSLIIPAGVTLTVGAGAILKFDVSTPTYGPSYQTQPVVSGTLNATGATFTSMNDNSIGGTTGTNTPARGDWGGIQVNDGGVATVTDSTISYANVAMSMSSSGLSSISGKISNSILAIGMRQGYLVARASFINNTNEIQSCNWGTSPTCIVDATYSYWGSSSGPPPQNPPILNPSSCGQVFEGPWYLDSARTQLPSWAIGPSQGEALFTSYGGTGENCDGTNNNPFFALPVAISKTLSAEASNQLACQETNLQSYCSALQKQQSCIGVIRSNLDSDPYNLTASGDVASKLLLGFETVSKGLEHFTIVVEGVNLFIGANNDWTSCGSPP